MHRGGDLSPHVVVPAGVELEVNGTWGREQGQKAMRKEEILQLLCCQPAAAVMTVIGCFCDCKSVSAAREKKNKMNHLQRHISFYLFLSLTKIDDMYLTVTPLHTRLFIRKRLRAQRKLKGGRRGTTAILRCSWMDEISNLFELIIPRSPLSQ